MSIHTDQLRTGICGEWATKVDDQLLQVSLDYGYQPENSPSQGHAKKENQKQELFNHSDDRPRGDGVDDQNEHWEEDPKHSL